MTCSACGAWSRIDASWCSQCHAAFAVAAPAEAAVPGRFVPRPDAPLPPQIYSRWRKSDTSFGPVGRVSWTIGMTFFAALFIVTGNIFAAGGWCFIAMPLVLRSVWSRSRVS